MRTVRGRFTLLYAAAFLLSGAALLALTNLAAGGRMVEPAPGTVPAERPATLAAALEQIGLLQGRLDQIRAEQAEQLLAGSAAALAVMAVASVVLGRFLAGRVLRPLRAVTAATRRISADNLHERLALRGPADEVTGLADTIDGLLERLEGAFAAQRRFVANAAHELRTPLATMRAALDVAAAKPGPVPAQTIALADRVRAELDQVDRLLEGFLMLARMQHDALSDRAPVPLDRVLAASAAARAADIAERGLSVDDSGVRPGVLAPGSRTLLTRLVDNLVDNAVVHNREGGRIRVAAAADGAVARLTVETDGPVLDPVRLARLGQPFQRLGADRTGGGSGLGLSIVAAIATAHGGGLDLSARPEGGLRAVVTLPAADTRPGDQR
ncbi:HAMP domain-containing sensor histidine kinase [Nocardiopsis trehalosi]|uniref:HAMP domain-containing sensor histidine kinase n=1 Tax=Nocardiopsis trehalosi TaxID=109329 RepID=UPI000A0557ED|nr:HAMP domain-containing sensor histidine kinase [Nocardiopsis trehalosi]